jgi:uncharacterized phiE125 gp8 family phage protein
MTLRVITGPAVEPLTVAEASAWAQISTTMSEPAPGAVTAALASPAVAGNVDDGQHRYVVTFLTAIGETQAGVVSDAVTVADKTVNGKVEITAIPLGGSLVASRKLYRTEAGGSTYLLLATIANNTETTYTDNSADADLGAGAPSANTTGDPKILRLIQAAREDFEDRTGRRVITQTVEQVYDAFPENEIKLGILPIQSIESVKYYDTDGTLQTLDSDQYVLDRDMLPGWLLPAIDTYWPSTRNMAQAVIIRMIVGYGDTGASVPAKITQWMSQLVKYGFDQPGPVNIGAAVNEMPRSYVDGLLDAFDIRKT